MEKEAFIADDSTDRENEHEAPHEGHPTVIQITSFFQRQVQKLLQRDEETGKSNVRALVTLFVLTVVSVLNQADRWVLAVVLPYGMRCPHGNTTNGTAVECSNATRISYSGSCLISDGCVEMSDTGQGLLTGTVFTVVYVLGGLPLAWLADRKSRLLVLVVGLTVWSLMCLCTGFVHEYWALVLVRMGLGLGEVSWSL